MLFMGGESQRVILSLFSGYSSQPQCTGKPSYLQPNRNTMQKPIEGLPALYAAALNKGGGSQLQEH